jgi:hypothetical protein
MKVINLSESQYSILFENIKSRNIHINESSDDEYPKFYEYLEDYDEYYVLNDFFFNNKEKQDWGVLINPDMYAKALREFTKYGKLINFPSKYVYQWMGIIMKNTAILASNTNLAGHSGYFPGDLVAELAASIDGIVIGEDFEEGSEWLEENGLYDWMEMPDGSDAWSDFGIEPLVKIFKEYSDDLPPEKVLVLVNRALDIGHMRGDMASIFIQGGSNALSKISENIKRSTRKTRINELKKYIMKIINLNESQFKKIFEGIENYGDNNMADFHDLGQTYTQAKITDPNGGDDEDSEPMTGDKFAHQQTPQQWGTVGGRNASNTI